MASGVLMGSHVAVSAEAIRAGQQTANRTNKQMASGIIPLTFPSTRSVLWDHRPTGPPAWVHFAHYRSPLVVLEEKSLRLAHHFAEQQPDSTSYRHLLIGSVTCDSDGEGVTVTIDRFAPLKEGRVAQEDVLPGQVLIECTLEKNSAKPTGSVDDLSNSLKTLHGHCTGKRKVDTSDLVILQAYCAYHSNQHNLLFHIDFNMVAPAVKFKVTPVPAVPIVPTALSKNLAGPMSMTDLQAEPKAGYLTMDHTRKLLLVLPSDPKVYTLPLIGIWVSGVSNVHDAFVWSRCLRYHCNHSLTDRVCLAPEPFLVVLYSPLHSQPEFYDCLPSNGSNDLHFELRTCHEVIQMSKLSGPRPDSPVELELVKVESGAKRDMFDAALQNCRDVLTRPAKCELQSSSHLSGSLEDMVPRSTPAPLLTRAPTFRPSVPEVSLLFDENRFVGGKTWKGSLDDNTGKSASNPVSAPNTRVPLKQVNRNPNSTQAPHSGKNAAVFPGMHAGPVAPPGSYPVQPYPYMAGFPPNPYGCMPMYGQPMATFPMPPVPYAWNMYNGYSGQPRCPTITGPRIRKAPSSRQQDRGENQRQQMEPPPHLAKQYHPQNYQHPPVSHQQQATTAYQPQVATNSGQQNMVSSSRPQQMTAASCQQQIVAASYQQQAAVGSYQQQAAAPLYQPQPVTAIKQDMQQQQQQRPQEQPLQQQHPSQQQQLLQQQQQQRQEEQSLQQFQQQKPLQQQQPSQQQQLLQQQQQQEQQLQQQQPLQQQQQQQRMLPGQQPVSHISSMQHQSPTLSRQSPVAAVRRADTSSTSASPLSNSTGRDSGMHSSDSADHDSLGTSYDAEASRAPPDVYEILRMQDTQLRLLREQLQQLTDRQGVPLLPPGGTAGQQTCSVAINTSALRDDSGDRRRSSDASDMSCQQSQGQTTSLQTSLDTAPSGGRLSESQHEPARHESNTSNDTLNLDELRLTQIQDEAESVMSDMIVDMPDYTSLSPEKIRPGSCSTCDCQGSDHCGHFDRSHMSQQDRHSDDDSGTDEDRDRDSYECSQTDVSLLLRNQKQFYENLMTNVNKFLGQHTSGEVTDDTVTTVQSESRPDRPAGGSIQSGEGARGLEPRGNKDSFVDIVENTKRELMKMGVNVDRLNAAEKSYRLDQSSCFMDQLMLPRVNYMSMMLDNDSDLSADADALAMKYLSDEQLTELARLRQHSPMKSRRHGDGLDRVFRGRDMSSCGVSANHMSFASRKYMERYGLLDADPTADDTVSTTPEVLNVGEFLKKLAADKSYLGSVCSHPDDTPANLTRVSYSSDPSPMLGGNLKWSRLSGGVSPSVFHQGDARGFHGPTSTPADNDGRMPSASSDVTPNRTPEKHRQGYQHHRHRGQPLTVDDHQPGRFFDSQFGEREAKKDFGPYFDGARREATQPQRKVERVLDIEKLKEMPKLM